MALDGDGWSDQRPPRWVDSEHPQQMHLDVLVPDVGVSGELAENIGARLLRDGEGHRVYADPAGHPFCLYADVSADHEGGPGRVGRVVFDCHRPRHLASFYEGLLEIDRTEDSPDGYSQTPPATRSASSSHHRSLEMVPIFSALATVPGRGCYLTTSAGLGNAGP